MGNLINCPDCGEKISESADKCPKCGSQYKAVFYERKDAHYGCGCVTVIIGLGVIALFTGTNTALMVLGFIAIIAGIAITIRGLFLKK